MTDHEGGVVPLLRLWIGYYGAPDARETGQIIERLANAYTQTLQRVGGRPARLAIEHLRIGSLLVDLKAAFETGAAIVTVVEQREMLVGFVQRVALAVQAVRDASMGIDISPSIRNFLYSFVKPVAAGRASEARLHVEGDNNVVIVIDGKNAAALDRILERLMPARGGGNGGGFGPVYMVPPTQQSHQPLHDQISRALGSPVPRMGRIVPFSKTASAAAIQEDRLVGATLQFVGDRWYARPETYGGLLLPVSGDVPPEAKLGFSYLVFGRVSMGDKAPIGFEVVGVVPDQRPQPTTS